MNLAFFDISSFFDILSSTTHKFLKQMLKINKKFVKLPYVVLVIRKVTNLTGNTPYELWLPLGHEQGTVHGNVPLKWVKQYVKVNRRFAFHPIEKPVVTDCRKQQPFLSDLPLKENQEHIPRTATSKPPLQL